jgi:hypothetical protein
MGGGALSAPFGMVMSLKRRVNPLVIYNSELLISYISYIGSIVLSIHKM